MKTALTILFWMLFATYAFCADQLRKQGLGFDDTESRTSVEAKPYYYVAITAFILWCSVIVLLIFV